MPSRLASQIASIDDIPKELVEIKEWSVPATPATPASPEIPAKPCIIEVRGMDGNERATMLRRYSTDTGRIDYEALVPPMLISCCFDPDDGSKVFEEGDEAMILTKASFVIERLSNTALRLSGLDRSAETEAGKGSSASPDAKTDSTPNSASTTTLPSS